MCNSGRKAQLPVSAALGLLGPALAGACGWLLLLGPPQLVLVLPWAEEEKRWLFRPCTGCATTVGGMSGAAGKGVNRTRRFFVSMAVPRGLFLMEASAMAVAFGEVDQRHSLGAWSLFQVDFLSKSVYVQAQCSAPHH